MRPLKKPVPIAQCSVSDRAGTERPITRFLPTLGKPRELPESVLTQDTASIRGAHCEICEAFDGRRPLRVRGVHPMVSTDGRGWVATALCAGCGATVGLLEHFPVLPAGVRIEAGQ